jgi:DNA polymerase (family X)
MDRHAVALVLEEIASLLDAAGENRFKARAFRTAARAVDKLEADLRSLVATGALRDVRGLGPATSRVVEELVVTGESPYYDELRQSAPSGIRELLRVPGLGPGRIARLHEELGITDLDSLEAAARAGRIATLRGFGARTEQQVLHGIPFARAAGGRRRFHHAEEAALRLASYIAALDGVHSATVAGALRRCLEVVDGIVLVAATAEPHRLLAALRRTPGVRWEEDEAGAARGRLSDGLPVELRLAHPDVAGAALVMATGSSRHLAALGAVAARRGLTIAADGVRAVDGDLRPAAAEEELYEALGLQFVPPELREDGSEVDLAERGALPRLVQRSDLRGCFHCHTTYSDGKATVAEMAEGALALGWRYLGIADHSRSAGYAGGLEPRRLQAQRAEIDRWNRSRGDELYLLAGIEADILADGQLDYAAQGDDHVLSDLDYVVGSVHSRFRMPRDAMTARMCRAVADPRLSILGHATGRLLLSRDGYDVDIDAVIRAAAGAGAIIEINADPHRLDLSWQHWALARELGVRAAINPDAHSVGGMQNVRFGINMARKAGLTAADVVNTWPLEPLLELLRHGKAEHG